MIIILYNGNEERFDNAVAAKNRIAYLIQEGISTNNIEVFSAERLRIGIYVEDVKLWTEGIEIK